MQRKRRSRTARYRTSILATLKESFQHDVFADLHEHLYSEFRRPSVIFSVHTNGKLRSCFPRRRDPIPSEIYHHLTLATSRHPDRAKIEAEKLQITQMLITRGKNARWGWYETGMGLVDLYLPIRRPAAHKNRAQTLLAVLVIGRFRAPKNRNMKELHSWIDSMRDEYNDPDTGKEMSPDHLAEYISLLHSLADKTPRLSKKTKGRLEYEADRSISLLERFLMRTASAEALFGKEGLIDQLGLREPDPSISVYEMWASLQDALQRTVRYLDIKSAAAYSSHEHDFEDLELRAKAGRWSKGCRSLAFGSFAEFAFLHEESWVVIPRHRDSVLGWIDPRALFDADEVILFGRIVGRHLVLFVFGMDWKHRLVPSQRTALYDAVSTRLVPFLETSLSAIELDDLMAETGHLLGRAIAKVASGYQSQKELKPIRLGNAGEDDELSLATFAIEEGLANLKLIRQNFYSFAIRRRAPEGESEGPSEDFDIVQLVEEMSDFFLKSAKRSGKEIKLTIAARSLLVNGDIGSLRLVLLNLFDNAMKFSYSGTHISIRVLGDSDFAVVEFENLGVGVAPDELKSVFKRFAKSRFKDPARRIEGMGLGLPLCKRVVEDDFGGVIVLESREAHIGRERGFEGDNWLTTARVEVPRSGGDRR